MSDWQPIETAPKDGTRILLGRFVKACPYKKYGFMAVDRWHLPEFESGWIGWAKFNDRHWPPTHWMPLPNPPEEN